MSNSLKVQDSRIIRCWNWCKSNILILLIPALTTAFLTRFLYILARLITHNIYSGFEDFFCFKFPFEGEGANGTWPFLPAFIIPYVMSYLYWIIIPFCIDRILGRKVFYRFCLVGILTQFFTFITFIIMPSYIDSNQPYFQKVIEWTQAHKDNNILGYLCDKVYSGDQPDNLFPSAHNVTTFIPILCCLDIKDSKKKRICIPFLLVTVIFYIFVMLATLFLRQHYLLDVISAIVLVCVAYWGVKYAPWLQRRITDFEIQITRWNINIKLQKSPKHKTVSTWVFVSFILLYILCIGLVLYFCALSLFTGDPFKSLWAWGA